MSKITIEDLKGTTAPQSPKKYSKNLTCAILTKSPIRPTRNGSMFSMNLCDQDPSSTVRAVCFDKNMTFNNSKSRRDMVLPTLLKY